MKLILLGMALAYVLSGAMLALILFVGDRAQRKRRRAFHAWIDKGSRTDEDGNAGEWTSILGVDWVRWGPLDETAEEAVERIIEESRT